MRVVLALLLIVSGLVVGTWAQVEIDHLRAADRARFEAAMVAAGE